MKGDIMKRFCFIILFSVFLASCSNTGTSVPTQITPTATAITIPTITPTLEPWMASLPEDVASVQVVVDEIIGLDAQGNQVKKYDLDEKEWQEIEKPITDIPAWLDDRSKTYWPGKYVVSDWNALLDKEVPSLGYDEINRKAAHKEVGWYYSISSAEVLGVQKISFKDYPVLVKYGSDGYFLEVAAEGTGGDTPVGDVLVLCGVDAPTGYVPICTNMFKGAQGHGPNYMPEERFLTAESLQSLVGRRLKLKLVSQVSWAPEKVDETKQQLIADGFNSPYPAGYHEQIVLRGNGVDLFWSLVADPNNGPKMVEQYFREKGLNTIPEELQIQKNGLAMQAWILKQYVVKLPFVMVDLIAEYNVSADDIGFR